jgi:hypothetical protein
MIEIQPDMANLRVIVDRDGPWLYFKTNDGREVTLSVQVLHNGREGRIPATIKTWSRERVDQAAAIRTQLAKKETGQ